MQHIVYFNQNVNGQALLGRGKNKTSKQKTFSWLKRWLFWIISATNVTLKIDKNKQNKNEPSSGLEPTTYHGLWQAYSALTDCATRPLLENPCSKTSILRLSLCWRHICALQTTRHQSVSLTSAAGRISKNQPNLISFAKRRHRNASFQVKKIIRHPQDIFFQAFLSDFLC